MQQALVELSMIERMMREDFTWPSINSVQDDMCEPSPQDVQRSEVALDYWDEVTGLPLDPKLVAKAEEEELTRFSDMNVYSHVSRNEVESDKEGIFVKTKWVRINKGVDTPKVRCRLVAQELAFGERMDEHFAGTPL